MISFVVPAHNEQACLPRTLQAIHESARAVNQPYEIIVVNDASTDSTAEIARENGARLVSVTHRQIAATRNSGARAALGARLFFVDADTTINARAVAAALRQMDKGAVGGGGSVCFEGDLPLYVRLVNPFLGFLTAITDLAGGAFLFCTRQAYQRSGGFNENLFFGEEGFWIMALKRQGRFVGLWQRVRTSGRRFRALSALDVLAICLRTAVSPVKMMTRRSSVEKVWYDSDRQNDKKLPNSPGHRLSNAIAFVLLLLLFTGWVWDFIPWSLTPLGSLAGKLRFAIAIFLTHAGMLFFWPCGIALAVQLMVNLLKRKWWAHWIKLTALCAFCFWQARGATLGTIWVWETIHDWMTKI